MNESRFSPSEFVETVAVRTLGKVGGSYENVLHHDPSVNKGENLARDLWPSSKEAVWKLDWRPVALKERGLCYSTEVPEEFVSAGVSIVSLKLHSADKFVMRIGTDINQVRIQQMLYV